MKKNLSRFGLIICCATLALLAGSDIVAANSPMQTLQGFDPTSGQVTASSRSAAEGTPTGQVVMGTVHVRTRLNVRTSPWGPIIGKLYNDSQVRIIGREGDWFKIDYNGQVAYVHSAYVTAPGMPSAAAPDGSAPSSSPTTSRPETTPAGEVPSGSLNAADFGYDSKYQPIFDLAEKYCQVNRKYTYAAGHMWKGYPAETDCSGFTCHLYQMLAQISGVQPAFPKNQWYPNSDALRSNRNLATKITSAYPPPNPRDLIKPGDIFVLGHGSSGIGHVGVFMGYTKSGNPVIAHSTPSTIGSQAIRGNRGCSGVRIEVMPSSYNSSRWTGIYRINGTDQMLDKLAKK
ncbi:MAG TPA: SH3 domain-containing protein [Candidatus Ozemobacteraceae bacterium]|nr:SH3 domain-containing protein [Candidatus Ozemobacteraceae bacterium]